jgi:hypothetical protein
MVEYAKIRCPSLKMDPIAPGEAPLGSIYLDANNADALSTKTTGGSQVVLNEAAQSIMIKRKRNMTGAQIGANKQISLKSNGSIILSDNDNPDAMRAIGFTLEAIEDGAYGNVLLIGSNVAGAVAGMGFNSGDRVYLSNQPGELTNDIDSFNPVTDTIYRVGIADCASETQSETATDLIMMAEIISTPEL